MKMASPPSAAARLPQDFFRPSFRQDLGAAGGGGWAFGAPLGLPQLGDVRHDYAEAVLSFPSPHSRLYGESLYGQELPERK